MTLMGSSTTTIISSLQMTVFWTDSSVLPLEGEKSNKWCMILRVRAAQCLCRKILWIHHSRVCILSTGNPPHFCLAMTALAIMTIPLLHFLFHLKTIMYTNVHLFVCEFKFRRQWRNSGATTKPILPGMSETLNYFAVEPQSKSYPSYGDIVNVMNNVVCLQGS